MKTNYHPFCIETRYNCRPASDTRNLAIAGLCKIGWTLAQAVEFVEEMEKKN